MVNNNRSDRAVGPAIGPDAGGFAAAAGPTGTA
jgi:hypothetical protein